MSLKCSLCSKFFFYLTLGYCLRTPDNSNLFSISFDGSSYRESTVFAVNRPLNCKLQNFEPSTRNDCQMLKCLNVDLGLNAKIPTYMLQESSAEVLK